MELKRFLALDEDDLAVISAHLEGAKVLRANIAYLPQERRFVLVVERHEPGDLTQSHLTGLHFDRVERVMTSQWPDDPNAVMTLVGVTFEMGAAPSGHIVLIFEDQRAVRLTVECIEAVLSDLPQLSEEKV